MRTEGEAQRRNDDSLSRRTRRAAEPLLEMAGLVESAIHNSVLALVDRDEQRPRK
jgi:hypothetical protein